MFSLCPSYGYHQSIVINFSIIKQNMSSSTLTAANIYIFMNPSQRNSAILTKKAACNRFFN